MTYHSLKEAVKTNDLSRLLSELSSNNSLFSKEELNKLFFISAATGKLDIVKALLKKGADINATLPLGETAVIWSIINKQIEVLDFLIKNGANVNAQTISGNSALIFAVKQNYLNAIELLYQSGAQLDLKNKENKTAIDFAGKEVVELLNRLSIEETKIREIPENLIEINSFMKK